MAWRGTDGPLSNWDLYSAAPLADVSDVDEIHTDGVAFGMDTNVGTLWL